MNMDETPTEDAGGPHETEGGAVQRGSGTGRRAPKRELPATESAEVAEHPHRAVWWALPAAVGGGLLGAVQARINSQLSAEIHDGFTGAVISFGSGLVILVVMFALMPKVRARARTFFADVRAGRFPWVFTLGGLGGATFVLGQTLTVGLLGVALFIVCVVAGQTVTGLVVDRVGFGPGGPRPLTVARIIGAVLMVVAVVMAMSGGVRTDVPLPLLILPVIAGLAVGLQQAMNGRVSQQSGHFLVATFTNFLVGTIALGVIAVIHAVFVAAPGPLPSNPLLYLGGAIGVVFIALAAHLAGPLGVLTLAMTTVAGQIIGSMLIDVLSAHPLTPTTIIGAGLTLVAALLTTLGSGALKPRSRR